MYPDNIYIQHEAELANMDKNPTEPGVQKADIGVALDIFDKEHGLEHNDLLRAQYKHYLAVKTGVEDLLSIQDKKILAENGVQL